MTRILKEIEAMQGETVDRMCVRFYGETHGFVEPVIEANRGLAALGPVLPMGTLVAMPDVVIEPSEVPLVRLWD